MFYHFPFPVSISFPVPLFPISCSHFSISGSSICSNFCSCSNAFLVFVQFLYLFNSPSAFCTIPLREYSSLSNTPLHCSVPVPATVPLLFYFLFHFTVSCPVPLPVQISILFLFLHLPFYLLVPVFFHSSMYLF